MDSIRIRCKKDAEFYEGLLRLVKARHVACPEAFDVPAIKRALRKFYHRADPERIMVRSDGIDGYVVRFPLPENVHSAEDADRYFMEYEYMAVRPSMYDCTGDLFTRWYKIVALGGRFWAYHSVGCDC